jgi:hypothetical protein
MNAIDLRASLKNLRYEWEKNMKTILTINHQRSLIVLLKDTTADDSERYSYRLHRYVPMGFPTKGWDVSVDRENVDLSHALTYLQKNFFNLDIDAIINELAKEHTE